jgi:hypothetical protein
VSVRILIGDCRERLRELPEASVDCVVTSPPFWRQRDYDNPKQLGTERTPQSFAGILAEIFGDIRRVLKPDGSAWIELGDTYAAGGNGGGGSRAAKRRKLKSLQERTGWRSPPPGYKEKDLSLTPFLVADRIRLSGWYLRKVIIWNKGTATEPPRLDRPSVSHSYIFLLTPNEQSRVRNPGEDWFLSSVWNIAPSGHAGNDQTAACSPMCSQHEPPLRCGAAQRPPLIARSLPCLENSYLLWQSGLRRRRGRIGSWTCASKPPRTPSMPGWTRRTLGSSLNTVGSARSPPHSTLP